MNRSPSAISLPQLRPRPGGGSGAKRIAGDPQQGNRHA